MRYKSLEPGPFGSFSWRNGSDTEDEDTACDIKSAHKVRTWLDGAARERHAERGQRERIFHRAIQKPGRYFKVRN
jgi:hypothetical protein